MTPPRTAQAPDMVMLADLGDDLIDELRHHHDDRASRTVLAGGPLHAQVMALRAGTEVSAMDTAVLAGAGTLYCIVGKVTLSRQAEDSGAQAVYPGQLVSVPGPGHAVWAQADSAVLLTGLAN